MTLVVVPKTHRAVVANFLFSHLGMFSILSMLALFLRDEGMGAGMVGLALGGYTLAQRASGLVTAAPLERISDRRGAAVAMGLTGVALVVLDVFRSTVAIPALVVVGVGVNANGLLVRSLLNRSHEGNDRHRAYANVNVAVNAAAAVGPLLGLLLYGRYGAGPVFATAAAAYCAAGLVVLAAPTSGQPQHLSRLTLRDSWAELWRMSRGPGVARLLATTALGWLAYAQLFSALPLFMADRALSDGMIAGVFTVNAVTVAGSQRIVSRVSERLGTRGWSYPDRLALGTLLFGLSFTVIAFFGGSVWTVVVAIVVFSLAEAVFTPTVDVAYAELVSPQRLAPVNLRQVAHATGETLGVLVGGTGYLVLERGRWGSAYWWICAVFVVVAAVVALASRRRAPRAMPAERREDM